MKKPLKILNMPRSMPGNVDQNRTRFYEVRNMHEGAPEMFIYDEIDQFWGIGAQMVVNDLNQLSDAEVITVRLNSPGGDSMEGFAIYNALVRHPAKIQIAIDGMALSAASVIAMAGETISMAENAFFMAHKPYTHALGNDEELSEIVHTLQLVGGSIAKVYSDANRKEMTEAEAMEMMRGPGKTDGTWYSASEAIEAGFVDELTDNLKIAANFDASRFTISDGAGGQISGVPSRFLARTDVNQARSEQIKSRLETLLATDI